MTSYVTPKINTAYVFYVSLEDKANPGLFKASPTLAAGDVKVSTDDGAPGNIATLPTVDADFTKRLKVSLSAGEMNGDNVTVIFSDAAGAEWYDLIVNIQTTARQIDDLAFPTTSGRGLDVSATGEAEANVTQLDGSAETVDNLVLSLGAGGLFAKLDTTLELDGAVYRFTLNALEQAPDSGLTAGETGDAVLDEVVEGAYTMRQLLRIMLAALAGKSSGGGTSTITFRDAADSKNRIAATVGGTGNRTAITLDGS